MKLLQQATRPAGGAVVTPPAAQPAAPATTEHNAVASSAEVPSGTTRVRVSLSGAASPVGGAIVNGQNNGDEAPGHTFVQGSADAVIPIVHGRNGELHGLAGVYVNGTLSGNSAQDTHNLFGAGGRAGLGAELRLSRFFVGVDAYGYTGFQTGESNIGGINGASTTTFASPVTAMDGGFGVSAQTGVQVSRSVRLFVGAEHRRGTTIAGGRELPNPDGNGYSNVGMNHNETFFTLGTEIGGGGPTLSGGTSRRLQAASNRLFFATGQPTAENLAALTTAVNNYASNRTEATRIAVINAAARVFMAEARNGQAVVPYVDAIVDVIASMKEDGFNRANAVTIDTWRDSTGRGTVARRQQMNLELSQRAAEAINQVIRFAGDLHQFPIGAVAPHGNGEVGRPFMNDRTSDQRALRAATGDRRIRVTGGMITVRQVANRTGVVTFYLGDETPPAAATPATPAAAPAAATPGATGAAQTAGPRVPSGGAAQ